MTKIKLISITLSALSLFICTKASAQELIQCGTASWYQDGSQTATGESFNPDGLTAAHRSLPYGSKVKVVLQDGKSKGTAEVIVRINDNGPFVGGRIIDLTRGAFQEIAPLSQRTAQVCIYRLQ